MRKYTISLLYLSISLAFFGLLCRPFIYLFGNMDVAFIYLVFGCIIIASAALSVISFVANFVDSPEQTSLYKMFSKLLNWNFYRKNKTEYTHKEYKLAKRRYSGSMIRFIDDKMILKNTSCGDVSIIKRTLENRTDYILFVDKQMMEHSHNFDEILRRSVDAEHYYPAKLNQSTLMSEIPQRLVNFFSKYKNIFYHWDGEKWYVANTPPNWHINSSKEEIEELKEILISNRLIMLVGVGSSYISYNGYYQITTPLNVESYDRRFGGYRAYNAF